MKGKRDAILEALKDKKNGKISTIYNRIHKTGSPFKTMDKRCTRGGVIKNYPNGITAQLVAWRIKHGWTVEKATAIPPRRKRDVNE